MVTKKNIAIFSISIVVLIVVALFFLRIPEDSWIKDSKGIWIKHGMPTMIPDYVREQQLAVDCAMAFYNNASSKNMSFSSRCLGTCGNYSVDIVNVPRMSEDNLAENQCPEYISKETKSFIELYKSGDIVRIV